MLNNLALHCINATVLHQCGTNSSCVFLTSLDSPRLWLPGREAIRDCSWSAEYRISAEPANLRSEVSSVNLESKMATSSAVKSCASKLTKAEKKALRKQTKLIHALRRHNADLASVSESPTRHLMVGNGGLMCGVDRSQIVSLFQKFGNIERLLMFPGRSFSFISFQTVSESVRAMETVHGRVLNCPSEFPRPDVTFYLSFLANVPDDVTIENQVKPAGLVLVEDFVTEAEEEELIQALGWRVDGSENEIPGTGIT